MFNECNLKGRSRYPVRGRVLVFTNSKKVEYVDNALTRSLPLYNFPNPNGSQGISFMCEFDGYLTFDANCHFRIIDVGPFEKAWYSAEFQAVYPADPYQPPILFTSVSGTPIYNPTTYQYAYTDVLVYVTAESGLQEHYTLRRTAGGLSYGPFSSELNAIFPGGTLFKGINAYGPFGYQAVL